MQFSELVGQRILIKIPRLHVTSLQPALLHGVESGGLWLEMDLPWKDIGAGSTQKTKILFLPYHLIAFAMAPTDKPAHGGPKQKTMK